MYSQFQSVMENWNVPNMKHAAPVGDTVITVPVETEDGEVTETVTVEQDGVSITIPFGTLVESNELTLTVTRLDASESEIEAGEGQTLMPFDVHVDGISAENTQPLTVALGKVMPENLNMGNYTVYHVEEDGTKEMTLVADAENLTSHNEYTYTLDGELTLNMASFSVIAAVTDNDNAWNGERKYEWYDADAETLYIRNADQLAGFGAIVGGMDGQIADDFAGQTVVLLADINIGDLDSENGIVFYPIGYYNSTGSYNKVSGGTVTSSVSSFEGTFDGNGHTISNFYQNTWEMFGGYNDGYSGTPNHYDDAMGLFGYVVNGTVKNLTVDKFSSDGEFTPTGVIAAYAENSTFENIAITNCNPRVYNTGNGGIIGIGGRTGDTTGQKLLLKNITVDNTNKISALWGSWDVACGGLVGMFRGNAAPGNGTIYFENCHVAAQIDVNNDVCANYQYYAYRYAGMMIGSVRHNTTDSNGKVVPVMTGIDASGCTVHYGKWNDYYYCELVANSIASYTHDYQFSRLTPVDAVDAENKTITVNGVTTAIPATGRYNYVVAAWKTPTENAKCYHFVDGVVWDHAQAGEETVNGETVLVENNQHIYLPFDQLFTGYSWGVSNIGLKDFDQSKIKILDREIADSVDKFNGMANGAEYVSGTTVTIGELFAAADQNNVAIVPGNVQVTVSPADDESTAGGTYTANTEDWTQGKLTFSGMGEATVTITDYYFCNPTTVTVTVKPVAKIGEVEYATLQDALDAVKDGGTVTLLENVEAAVYLDIYTPDLGATERNITLDLNEKTISAGENYKYQYYPLVFVGINQTVTIKNGTIRADKHVAVGVYGTLNLENVNVLRDKSIASTEQVVCIWNWGEDDLYYEDCPYQLTGIGSISGGKIVGGVLVEGPLTLDKAVNIDKLYLNTETGHGRFDLPSGYGLVKEEDYYTNLHKHNNGVCTECGLTTSYVKKDLAEIKSTDVVIVTVTTSDGTVYALSNNNGTTAAPTAVDITVSEDKVTTSKVADEIEWNISNDGGDLTFYPNGSTTTWLYCINDNNGVRVGVNTDDVFVIDAETGYLKHVATSRYVGVYNAQDWRCYETNPITNKQSNIKDQTLAFYVRETDCTHEGATENRTEIAATCTEAGHEAGVYCTVCNTYTEGGALINALGHTFGDPIKTEDAGDCKVRYTYRCTVCNKKSVNTVTTHTTIVVDEAVTPTCTETGLTEGSHCDVCSEVIVVQEVLPATGHSYVDGVCGVCGVEESDTPSEPVVVLEITKDDFNGTSYDNNNNTKIKGDYSYTSNQVMLQSSTMQWQKSTGYITIASNDFVKLEMKVTAGTFTVTVGDTTVTGTTSNGVTTYDLTGLTGEIKISVGSATGKVDYIKFYK